MIHLDKDKNSDADYANGDVLIVLMFSGKQCQCGQNEENIRF